MVFAVGKAAALSQRRYVVNGGKEAGRADLGARGRANGQAACTLTRTPTRPRVSRSGRDGGMRSRDEGSGSMTARVK